MHIREFGVEIWMNANETRCELNLAETCVASLTVQELLDLTGKGNSILDDLLPLKLTYGAIEGAERLRRAIAALYETKSAADVLVTHGAIGANALVYQALVGPRDAVVSVLPTYQQHYSIPESLGAEVRPLWLRAEDAFLPDLDRLRDLARGAKLVALTNPNNPTGALIDRPMLEEIVAIARAEGAWLLADEVYRGVDQEGDGFTASVADLYEKGISTGSMSKAYALAGLRLGWIAAPAEVLRAAMIHRDYNTISVSMIDDHFADSRPANRATACWRAAARSLRGNLAILSEWVDAEPLISWVRPRSGTISLVRNTTCDMSSEDIVRAPARRDRRACSSPVPRFDMDGHCRIGYANSARTSWQ
jgi:aspartate/methionine/tyrosine aminotransferase